ncbi:hypothetical protein NL676_039069 [Syzygium grande]|nr:hypothetical protein NL676_039069 [Syzygium grande]
MAESPEAWPVGLRFKPTEDELIGHYLKKKLIGEMETLCLIPELCIYNWEPPELFTRYNELSSIPSDGSVFLLLSPWSTNLGMYEYHLKSNVSDSEISDPTALVLCHIINRKSKKVKSATASTSTDLSGPSNLNDSQNEGTQEIGAQASLGVTVEFPYPNEMSNFNLPDQNVPIPDPQPQTSKEQQLSHDDHRHVGEPSDGHYSIAYSPSDCIDLADLFNYDESID